MKNIKKLICFLGAGIFAFSLAACGASASKDYFDDNAFFMESAEAVTEPSYYGDGYMMDSQTSMYNGEAYKGDGSVEVKENAQTSKRKLIKTYGLDLETEEFESLLPAVTKRVSELGGYIESLDTYNGNSGYRSNRYSSIKARIPADRAEEFIDFVGNASNITNQSLNVNDVTLSYVDMKSEKDAYIIEQERLLALLEKAESIEDMITIESRLSTVRYKIETMESQLRTYDNLVDYSTVNIYISEVKKYSEPEPVTYGERVAASFRDGIDSFTEGCGDFFVWFVGAIPALILWAVVICILVLVIKKIGKKKTKKANKKTEQKEEKAENTNE